MAQVEILEFPDQPCQETVFVTTRELLACLDGLSFRFRRTTIRTFWERGDDADEGDNPFYYYAIVAYDAYVESGHWPLVHVYRRYDGQHKCMSKRDFATADVAAQHGATRLQCVLHSPLPVVSRLADFRLRLPKQPRLRIPRERFDDAFKRYVVGPFARYPPVWYGEGYVFRSRPTPSWRAQLLQAIHCVNLASARVDRYISALWTMFSSVSVSVVNDVCYEPVDVECRWWSQDV